jgi:hypothetical protein
VQANPILWECVAVAGQELILDQKHRGNLQNPNGWPVVKVSDTGHPTIIHCIVSFDKGPARIETSGPQFVGYCLIKLFIYLYSISGNGFCFDTQSMRSVYRVYQFLC